MYQTQGIENSTIFDVSNGRCFYFITSFKTLPNPNWLNIVIKETLKQPIPFIIFLTIANL